MSVWVGVFRTYHAVPHTEAPGARLIRVHHGGSRRRPAVSRSLSLTLSSGAVVEGSGSRG